MSRGVIAITADKAIGRTLRIGLAAAGTEATVVSSVSELPAGRIAGSVMLFHQVGSDLAPLKAVAGRLRDSASIVALVPRGDLTAAVAAMKAHDKVVGALRAENLTSHEVSAVASRLVHGDLFGIDKVLPWGSRVHSLLVGDYEEKERSVRRISDFAASVGVRRKFRERIERCCDEMLMNALYDAPVGRDGVPVAHRAARRSRITLPPEDKALVEFGCDGRRFAVGVRDRFGRFERGVLLRYLDKCLHAEQQIDDKVGGGAGLGLYFISRSASSVLFNLLPGVATECICTFDVEAAEYALEQIGVFHERVDPSGRLIEQPVRVGRHPVERRRGARPSPASAPDGSAVDPGTPEAEAEAEIARPRRARTLLPILAAIIIVGGLGTALLFPDVAAMVTARFEDWSVGGSSEPTSQAPTTPVASVAAADGSVAAPPDASTPALQASDGGGSLSIAANLPGRITVRGEPDCSGRSLPLQDCPLSRGAHEVLVENSKLSLRHAFTVNIDRTHVRHDLRFGFVEARRGYLVATTGRPVRRAALAEGRQTVILLDAKKRTFALQVPVTADRVIVIP